MESVVPDREYLAAEHARGGVMPEVGEGNPGPYPPPEWARAWRELVLAAAGPVAPPPWWRSAELSGGLATLDDSASQSWDGIDGLVGHEPGLLFQLTLAGQGELHVPGQPPVQVFPGSGFVAVDPAHHSFRVADHSPGWTFAWLAIYHPYILQRVGARAAAIGPAIAVAPDGGLAASVVRLVRGTLSRDFRDRFEVELALIELALAYERSTGKEDESQGGQLLEEVRARVVRGLPEAIDVNTLASDYGMSRTHFSHFFRDRTGLTPSHFATKVRIDEAARLLLDTHVPLKRVAIACGFANANHFCKVFRRFQYMSPISYRRAIP